jgi:acetyl esterase
MAKERGLGDAIKCQVLIYPATSPETDWESYQKYGQGDYPLSLKDGELFSGSYFPAPTKEMQDRYATPLISTVEQLTGLPPAFVITAECDILRDEGEAYGAKLLEAGVETAGIRVTGAIHGFMSMPVPETPQYRSALTSAIDFIKVQLKLN